MSNSFATLWTEAGQASLSVGFPRQEYWNVLPFPSPGDLPDQGIEPVSPALAGGFFTTGPPGKPSVTHRWIRWIYISTLVQVLFRCRLLKILNTVLCAMQYASVVHLFCYIIVLSISPGEGNGTPLQYSCPENPRDRGAWRATVRGVARVGHGLVTKPVSISPKLLFILSAAPSPLGTMARFLSVSLFLFVDKFLCLSFRFHT